MSEDVRDDFVLRDGRLYTWLPPQETALASVIKGGTDAISTADWADSAAQADQRALVQLLNFALRQDVAVDCDWHAVRKIVYFRATDDLTPWRIRGASGRQRLVFNPKPKKTAPDEISYCQHAALEWQFLYADGQWFCALTPTYHYTCDGHRDSLYLSELLSGNKRLDRNPAVYHQTRMWATYLHGEEGVLDPRENILDYGELLTHLADRGIDDAAWLTDPRIVDTASDDVGDLEEADDADPDDEPRLFEVEA